MKEDAKANETVAGVSAHHAAVLALRHHAVATTTETATTTVEETATDVTAEIETALAAQTIVTEISRTEIGRRTVNVSASRKETTSVRMARMERNARV